VCGGVRSGEGERVAKIRSEAKKNPGLLKHMAFRGNFCSNQQKAMISFYQLRGRGQDFFVERVEVNLGLNHGQLRGRERQVAPSQRKGCLKSQVKHRLKSISAARTQN